MGSRRKRSRAPSRSKGELPDLEFFTDRDVGEHIVPDALREAGLIVHRLVDEFPIDTPDAVWLQEVASRGWVVITCNAKIRYNRLERDALMRSGARVIMLPRGDTNMAQMARNLVNSASQIRRFVARQNGPFIATLSRPNPVELIEDGKPGRIRKALDHETWLASQGDLSDATTDIEQSDLSEPDD